MRPSTRRLTTLARALAVALLTACGKKDAAADATDTATATDTASAAEGQPAAQAGAAQQPAASASSAPVTVADIERWQRGIAAELKAVQDAEAKLRSAKTAMDTANLTLEMTDMGTVGAGARAAGASEDRYRFIQSTLSSLVANLTPYEAEMDTKGMPAAMVAEVKQGREATVARMAADLQPDVIDALRPRALELRRQDMALAAARLKAAGAVR